MAARNALSPQALRLMWGLDPAAFLSEFEVSPVLGHFALPLYEEMPSLQRHAFLDRVPDFLGAGDAGPGPAFTATDWAIRKVVPLALTEAGFMEAEAFAYLLSLHPIHDRDTARVALNAAWDACVTLARRDGPPEAWATASEARDAASEALWGTGPWTLGCAHHAARAVAHCARTSPRAAWDLGLGCLDRMLGRVA